MAVTIELKVHILIFWFSSRLGRVCSSRFELSQFRSHNGFHPTYQFSCSSTEPEAWSYLFPAVLRFDRLVTRKSGSSMIVEVDGSRAQARSAPESRSRRHFSSGSLPPTAMPKPSIGPSRLSQVLQKLKADPKPALSPSLRSLKVTYAKRNNHFGARYVRRSFNYFTIFKPCSDVLYVTSVGNCRHFVKEELPRIQYANPTLAIEVSKVLMSREDTWQSSLIMEFGKFLQALVLVVGC